MYLSNPDNPTGRTVSIDGVASLLCVLPRGCLIVDETYFEFAGVTAIPLIDRFDNLLVMRSFSKAFGLAGLRCGYTVSKVGIVERLRRFWNGRDVNAAAQAGAAAALDDLRVHATLRGRSHCGEGLAGRMASAASGTPWSRAG